MGLLTVVLVIVLLAFNLVAYHSQYNSIESALEYALETGPEGMIVPNIGGVQDMDRDEFADPGDDSEDSDDSVDDALDSSLGNIDTSIPVYCVSITSDGQVKAASTNASMSAELVSEAIAAIAEDGSSSGELSDLGLMYSVDEVQGELRIAFADSESLHDDATTRFLFSVLVGIIVLGILFVISLWLSRYALKPVEEAWDGQQRFIADASHELKTPLTVILANNEIIKAHPDSTVAEQQRWIDSTDEEAMRMQGLVKDLLVLAQTEPDNIQTFRSNMNMEVLDFSSLVEMNILQFEAVAFDKGVQIEEDVQEGLMVEGDEEKFNRVIRVLLDNACKYASTPGEDGEDERNDAGVGETVSVEDDAAATDSTQEMPALLVAGGSDEVDAEDADSSGIVDDDELAELLESGMLPDSDKVVMVKLRKEKSSCILTVNNKGDPIPPEDLPHIFEKFFRGDKARSSKSEGYGLGLSIAKNIVEGCGGSIYVDSDVVHGTTFTVKLPLA